MVCRVSRGTSTSPTRASTITARQVRRTARHQGCVLICSSPSCNQDTTVKVSSPWCHYRVSPRRLAISLLISSAVRSGSPRAIAASRSATSVLPNAVLGTKAGCDASATIVDPCGDGSPVKPGFSTTPPFAFAGSFGNVILPPRARRRLGRPLDGRLGPRLAEAATKYFIQSW